jgi:hypothetical protein
MPVNTLAILDKLETIVDQNSFTTRTVVGIPTTLDVYLTGFVALAAPLLSDRAQKLAFYQPRFYLGLAYRLAGSTPPQIKTAERTLTQALDELVNDLLEDRTLGGVVNDITLDFSFANNALYQAIAGQEARIFPISLEVTVYLDLVS